MRPASAASNKSRRIERREGLEFARRWKAELRHQFEDVLAARPIATGYLVTCPGEPTAYGGPTVRSFYVRDA